MPRKLKEKICKTCLHRLPEILNLSRTDTRPQESPVDDCKIGIDVFQYGVCGNYKNLWTGRDGELGNPPQARPRI